MTPEQLGEALEHCHAMGVELAELCGHLVSTMADGNILLEEGIQRARESLLCWHRAEPHIRALIREEW